MAHLTLRTAATPDHPTGQTAASAVVVSDSPDRRPPRCSRWWRSVRGLGGVRVLSSAVGGYLLNLSFAPHTWWWAAIFGIALLGLAIRGRRLWPAAGLTLVFGLTFYLPLLNWTTVYVGRVAVALAVAEAILTMPVGALIASASRRLPVWPAWAAAAWVAGEALRGHFPFGGFPWGGVSFSQVDGPLLPSASLLGESGLTFLTALAGFGLAAVVRTGWANRSRPSWTVRALSVALVGPVVCLAVPFGFGLAGLATVQNGTGAPTEQIAIIQGNVPRLGLDFNAQRRAVTELHAERTHDLAAAVRAGKAPKPQLVIWPENASDVDPYTDATAAAIIMSAVKDIGVPVLVGAVVSTGTPGENWNMGIVWDPVTGPGQTYTKRHPVPFGEYMPYRSFFRLFSSKVDLQQGKFVPGTRPGNLAIAGVNVGDVICFEVVYDGLVRDVVNGGAKVLVVQTNNATFGLTDETFQQLAMGRIRAVEYGREVLVAATSGVSAVIRPDGSVESTVPQFTAGYLTPTVPLISATTPGTVLGGPLEWVLTAGVLLALFGVTLLGRIRKRRAADGTPIVHDGDAESAGPSATVSVPAGPAVRPPEEDPVL